MNFRQLIQVIKDNRFFFITYNLLLLIGLYPLLTRDKLTVFLFINKHHHPFLDKFFYYITYLGDGITYGLLLITLWLLKVSFKKLLIGAASFVGMSIIVQSLKRIIFSHYHRPIKLVDDLSQLHIVDGVDIVHYLSFPSGHAGTIFVAACFLSLIGICKSDKSMQLVAGEDVTELIEDVGGNISYGSNSVVVAALFLTLIKIRKSTLYSLFLLVVAALVAYSRVYLCQHFYTDVYVGALIGGWITFLMYAFLIDKPMPSWLANRFFPKFKL
jgi:membrane-associated phospholipid phosphatase